MLAQTLKHATLGKSARNLVIIGKITCLQTQPPSLGELGPVQAAVPHCTNSKRLQNGAGLFNEPMNE